MSRVKRLPSLRKVLREDCGAGVPPASSGGGSDFCTPNSAATAAEFAEFRGLTERTGAAVAFGFERLSLFRIGQIRNARGIADGHFTGFDGGNHLLVGRFQHARGDADGARRNVQKLRRLVVASSRPAQICASRVFVIAPSPSGRGLG